MRICERVIGWVCSTDGQLILSRLCYDEDLLVDCMEDMLCSDVDASIIQQRYAHSSERKVDLARWITLAQRGKFNMIDKFVLMLLLRRKMKLATRRSLYRTLVGGSNGR